MKRITLLLMISALAFLSCKEAQDTRYFAPDVEFGEASYSVQAESGGADLLVRLSRPAPRALTIGLNLSSSLKEDLQFHAPHALELSAGDTEAKVHIDLVDDEIWDENAWIDLTIAPGDRYTVNPDGKCTTRLTVTKAFVMPTLRLRSLDEDTVTNPFLAETLHFEITADRVPSKDIAVTLNPGGLVPGTDCLIGGAAAAEVTLPSGADKVAFDLTLLQKDESGMDRHETLALVQQKGLYVVPSEGGSVDIHLSDPVVDFSPLFKSPALQSGEGYQIRQAFLAADGSWSGNTTVDLGVSSKGSNYLRTFRNMYDHPSFGCPANASVSQLFRLSDLFPNYVYPNATAILDYGNDQGHREFSPADSLMRFVLDKGETQKGTIHFYKPRTFTAFIGSYAAWQDKSVGGENSWIRDSRATKGDIYASTHPAITGQISVTLEKLEGTFDLTNSSEPVLVTAWFSSDSDMFMKADEARGVDPAGTYAVSKEDGLWKVSYKFWPR